MDIQNLKKYLRQKSNIKWKYFKGIKVVRSRKTTVIYQQKYMMYLLEETNMLGAKPAGATIEQNH